MKKVIGYVKPYLLLAGLTGVSGIVVSSVNVWIIEILKQIIDSALTGASFGDRIEQLSSDMEEFIEKLPDRYDTLVSAGGSNLSGGQRQRIAIARAFLKDAPILLMDEPSSALDIQSDKMVHRALEKLTAQKVVIMVSHQGKPQEGGGWREVRMK